MNSLKKTGLALGILSGTLLFGFTTVHADVNVYRLYNPNTGEHFYTTGLGEKNALASVGWNYEGTGWVAPNTGTAVYRVYNPNAQGGDHYYTKSKSEAQSLVKLGWHWDNGGKPVFYSGGKVSVYVAYNPNAQSGAHNYTTNKGEQSNLLSVGWRFGAVAWNAVAGGKAAPASPYINGPAGPSVQVDKNVTGVGGAEANVPGSYRLQYSNKPFDNATLTGNALIEFSADLAITGNDMSQPFETQFVIGSNSPAGGQIGISLRYMAGTDSRFGQGRIVLSTINFPADAGTKGQQFYSVNTAAPAIGSGQLVHLQLKYFASGYVQVLEGGKIVGQYRTSLKGNTYILHDQANNSRVAVRNLKVLSNGTNITKQGIPPFSSTSYDLNNNVAQGAYQIN